MPTLIHQFDESNPFSVDKLNDSLAKLVGAINALAQDSQLQLSPAPGNDGNVYVPVSGGSFVGQVSFPSVLIGDPDGVQYSPLTKEDVVSLSALSLTASGSYTQSEIQSIADKLDVLITALKS